MLCQLSHFVGPAQPMQGVNCVKGEIHNVLTVLRLCIAEQQGSPSRLPSEHADPLVRGFQVAGLFATPYTKQTPVISFDCPQDLHAKLGHVADLAQFDTRVFLGPFLAVIHSHETDVVATGIALHRYCS
jgi:hypothetical protein